MPDCDSSVSEDAGAATRSIMGRLTTHVLDQAAGRPAAGLRIDLWRIDGTTALLKTVVTNADGRCDGAILEGATLSRGRYELRFHAGDYLRANGIALPD